MNSTLLDLSGKIDPGLLGLFSAIGEVADSLAIRFFVIGATARDMIMEIGYGVGAQRATRDVDLGVQVADWHAYQDYKSSLIASGFELTTTPHRLLYRNRIPVDIVPFGPLKQSGNRIAWPPDGSIRMNVAGFEDAFRGAQVVRLRAVPNLQVRIAMPSGLALLKLIAWRERYPAGGKDAGDLDFLIRHYMDAGNRERLAEEYPDWLEQDDFDYEQAGARLLGRDMANIMLAGTLELVLEILGEETRESGRNRLVADMLRPHGHDGTEAEVCRALLVALLTGLKEDG